MIRSENYKIGSKMWKYVRNLEERRGKNCSYLSDKKRKEIELKGYSIHKFDNGKIETSSLLFANEIVIHLRQIGYYARVIVNPSYMIKGAQTYCIYKKKSRT